MTTGSDDGQRAQALLEKGAGLYEEGKLYEAISCWRQVLMIEPGNEIAAEYLRFIEDNFQIGIDTFLEHHAENPAASTFDGEDDDLAAAIDDSINALLDESIEELDWSELLEEPLEESEPPPPSDVAEIDEAFFAELDEGSLTSDPGAEAEAWGRSLLSPTHSSGSRALADASMEMMPQGDPFTLPTDHFAADYAPGEFEATGELADVGASAPVTGPRPEGRRRPGAQRKDLADMSEDSIDSLLDEDFKAWEHGGGDDPPADSYELPFETPGSSPPRAAVPDARPSQPSLDAHGAPVERRRRPTFEGDAPQLAEHPLQRHTGPLEAVDPRRRDELGVERVSRTTPPTPMQVPPEAMPAAGLAERQPVDRAPLRADPAPEPEPPSRRRALRGTPKEQANGPGTSAERQRAAESLERVEAAQAAQPYRPPTQSEAPAAPAAPAAPETDLDDELRALLTAGIAEIEAVERPVSKPRRLIEAPPPGTDLDALMVDARRRQQADDFTGAIELVEQVLAADPTHAEARRYLEANTDRLMSIYRARLGSLGRVPRVKLRQQEIVWQSLDHREGFILSQVDGRTSFEEIIDISGMPVLESTRILARLVDHGVIG